MKKIVLLFIFIVWLTPLFAQSEKSRNGYRVYFDVAIGDAYNLNTAQTISTNNMQWFGEITTTHGYVLNAWFIGGGLGYYHSFRDKENMYPFFVAGRYTFEKAKIRPYIEVRAGIVYDPLWIRTTQAYGALNVGMNVYKGLQVGIRGSIFSRPSRYFTANAAFVIGFELGK